MTRKTTMKACLATLAAAAIAVGAANGATTPDGTHPGYPDNLVFSLGFKGPLTLGDSSTYANVYDEMTFGSESPLVATTVSTYDQSSDAAGYAKYGTPDPICVTSGYVVPCAYPWTSNVAEFISFPSSMRVYEDSGTFTTNCFPQSVKFGRSVPTGSNVTYHVRFRWDGNLRGSYEQRVFDNGMDANGGFGFHIYHNSTKALHSDLVETRFRIYIANSSINVTTLATVQKGVWYDFVVRMTWSENCDGNGNPGTSVRMVRKALNGGTVRSTTFGDVFLTGKTCATAASTALPISLSYGNASKWSAVDSNNGSSFRGDVAKLQIYDRALTDAEMLALFSGSDGTLVSAGSENGSADEFGSAEDAEAVYDPKAMPMRKMLGSLTASNPSLSFKFPLRAEEERMPMLLRLATDREGGGAVASVVLSVNGKKVDSLDFARNAVGEFRIPERNMVRDGEGNVTVALTRTGDLSGSLKIDAFKLFGSWQVGAEDSSNADWCFRAPTAIASTSANYAYVVNSWGLIGGPTNVPGFFNELFGMKKDGALYFPYQTLAFYLSPEAAARNSTFLFRNANSTSARTMHVYANGTLYKTGLEVPVSTRQTLSVEFPAGSLNAGINYLTISNATDNLNGPSQYVSFQPDFYGFRAELPPSRLGFAIIFK